MTVAIPAPRRFCAWAGVPTESGCCFAGPGGRAVAGRGLPRCWPESTLSAVVSGLAPWRTLHPELTAPRALLGGERHSCPLRPLSFLLARAGTGLWVPMGGSWGLAAGTVGAAGDVPAPWGSPRAGRGLARVSWGSPPVSPQCWGRRGTAPAFSPLGETGGAGRGRGIPLPLQVPFHLPRPPCTRGHPVACCPFRPGERWPGPQACLSRLQCRAGCWRRSRVSRRPDCRPVTGMPSRPWPGCPAAGSA